LKALRMISVALVCLGIFPGSCAVLLVMATWDRGVPSVWSNPAFLVFLAVETFFGLIVYLSHSEIRRRELA